MVVQVPSVNEHQRVLFLEIQLEKALELEGFLQEQNMYLRYEVQRLHEMHRDCIDFGRCKSAHV